MDLNDQDKTRTNPDEIDLIGFWADPSDPAGFELAKRGDSEEGESDAEDDDDLEDDDYFDDDEEDEDLFEDDDDDDDLDDDDEEVLDDDDEDR